MINLLDYSIELIKKRQLPEGAWYADSGYQVYRYSWFRDNSFIAYAMDKAGEMKTSARYHQWVIKLFTQKEISFSAIYSHIKEVGFLPYSLLIETRYLENGDSGEMFWENHQLDGLGTWIWSFQEHLLSINREATKEELEVVQTLADYLSLLWRFPCYDLWEEFGDKVHFYTLSSVQAGLKAAQIILGRNFENEISQIEDYISAKLVRNGHFVKYTGDLRVDASMLARLYPYGLCERDDPIFLKTVEIIRKQLYASGVHRYVDDEYYGGGEWILLAAWAGIVEAQLGNISESKRFRSWIESIGEVSGGILPEQLSTSMNRPARYDWWLQKWGAPAQELLWSHAMYVLLKLFH